MTTHGATLTIGTMLACTACKCHLFAEELDLRPSSARHNNYMLVDADCPDCGTTIVTEDRLRETVHGRRAA